MDVRKFCYSWWNDADHQKLSYSEERELHAAKLAGWRRDGCCTQCGGTIIGDIHVLDDQGVAFFGEPHLPGDRLCFWCFEEAFWQPDTPSRYHYGRA